MKAEEILYVAVKNDGSPQTNKRLYLVRIKKTELDLVAFPILTAGY